jgi:hypothetical protein
MSIVLLIGSWQNLDRLRDKKPLESCDWNGKMPL